MKIINIDFKGSYKDGTCDGISNLELNQEASEYEGRSYQIDSIKFIQRTSKVTPKKNGQFVTLWKRDFEGVTCPIDFEDDFDYVVVICKKNDLYGKFVFPKQILFSQGFIGSINNINSGKRGFRVYPDWDEPRSKQAIKTQQWQISFFDRSLTLNTGKLIV